MAGKTVSNAQLAAVRLLGEVQIIYGSSLNFVPPKLQVSRSQTLFGNALGCETLFRRAKKKFCVVVTIPKQSWERENGRDRQGSSLNYGRLHSTSINDRHDRSSFDRGVWGGCGFHYRFIYNRLCLLRRQQRFQDDMFEKQRKHEETIQERQHRHEDDLARERRNYEKTGIASMRKIEEDEALHCKAY